MSARHRHPLRPPARPAGARWHPPVAPAGRPAAPGPAHPHRARSSSSTGPGGTPPPPPRSGPCSAPCRPRHRPRLRARPPGGQPGRARGWPCSASTPRRRRVALARRRGAAVLEADVFGPLPGEGRWATCLLFDGTIGIGGDPTRLLARCRELTGPGGRVLAEVEPPGTGLAPPHRLVRAGRRPQARLRLGRRGRRRHRRRRPSRRLRGRRPRPRRRPDAGSPTSGPVRAPPPPA